jgi:hypothetical protein
VELKRRIDMGKDWDKLCFGFPGNVSLLDLKVCAKKIALIILKYGYPDMDIQRNEMIFDKHFSYKWDSAEKENLVEVPIIKKTLNKKEKNK